MEPLNKDTYSAELAAIREPSDDVVRKPLQWIVPAAESTAENPEDECADRAYKTMMAYIKLLQKHYSDLIMTTKLKELTPEEQVLWEKDRYDVMFKIVENYSIIEFVKFFPAMVKPGENGGKTQFDLSAFHPHLKKGKDGKLYIDEYEMNAGKAKQDADHTQKQQLRRNHLDYDEELDRVLTEAEVDERTTPGGVTDVVELDDETHVLEGGKWEAPPELDTTLLE